MILVDNALKKRQANGNPVKVAMVGAGFMARGVALQISKYTPGMELVVIANRNLENARRAYVEAGIETVRVVEQVKELEDAMRTGVHAITDDPMLVCQAEGIDALLEATGAIEYSAHVALEAINNRKHFLLMGAELGATVGPILKLYADQKGVVFSDVDGDQPGVQMNLYRFVEGLGVTPVLCGNISGLQDRYRNPTTQEGFAKKWGQKPHMVTSFADGTKKSFEQTLVANATGMRVATRGMHGPRVPPGTPIKEAVNWYPVQDLIEGPGIVEYVVGAEPGAGVFVLGTNEDSTQKHYLNLYKVGEGPLYCFYNPYHLCHFEVPGSIARAVLFDDAVITPIGPPLVDVVTTAKIDLTKGQQLDGIGWYMTYGQCENSATATRENLLPMALAEGCTLKSDIPKDQVLTYDDVVLPAGRLIDKLRTEQDLHFAKERIRAESE